MQGRKRGITATENVIVVEDSPMAPLSDDEEMDWAMQALQDIVDEPTRIDHEVDIAMEMLRRISEERRGDGMLA